MRRPGVAWRGVAWPGVAWPGVLGSAGSPARAHSTVVTLGAQLTEPYSFRLRPASAWRGVARADWLAGWLAAWALIIPLAHRFRITLPVPVQDSAELDGAVTRLPPAELYISRWDGGTQRPIARQHTYKPYEAIVSCNCEGNGGMVLRSNFC